MITGHLQKHKRSSAHETRVEMTQAFGIPSSDNPRPYGCTECDIGFRKHGHLAKHLRSKSHITKLEANGLIPMGTYAALEKFSNLDLKERLVTTNCEQSLRSLRSIAETLFPNQPMIELPGGEQKVAQTNHQRQQQQQQQQHQLSQLPTQSRSLSQGQHPQQLQLHLQAHRGSVDSGLPLGQSDGPPTGPLGQLQQCAGGEARARLSAAMHHSLDESCFGLAPEAGPQQAHQVQQQQQQQQQQAPLAMNSMVALEEQLNSLQQQANGFGPFGYSFGEEARLPVHASPPPSAFQLSGLRQHSASCPIEFSPIAFDATAAAAVGAPLGQPQAHAAHPHQLQMHAHPTPADQTPGLAAPLDAHYQPSSAASIMGAVDNLREHQQQPLARLAGPPLGLAGVHATPTEEQLF